METDRDIAGAAVVVQANAFRVGSRDGSQEAPVNQRLPQAVDAIVDLLDFAKGAL